MAFQKTMMKYMIYEGFFDVRENSIWQSIQQNMDQILSHTLQIYFQ